jgi:phage terminase large subunit
LNIIRTLPQLQHDETNPNDVATEPHELTHAPDALRGFCSMRQSPSKIPTKPDPDNQTPEEKHQKMVKSMTGGQVPKGFFNYRR